MACLIKEAGAIFAGFPPTACAVGSVVRSEDTAASKASAKARLKLELERKMNWPPEPGGRTGQQEPLSFSFSHLPGATWAAAMSPPGRIGIDAAAEPEFEDPYPLHRAFHPAELQVEKVPPAGLWAMKEAVVKALGCGFNGLDPLQVYLAFSDDSGSGKICGTARVSGPGGKSFCLPVWCRRHGGIWLALSFAAPPEISRGKEGKPLRCIEK